MKFKLVEKNSFSNMADSHPYDGEIPSKKENSQIGLLNRCLLIQFRINLIIKQYQTNIMKIR